MRAASALAVIVVAACGSAGGGASMTSSATSGGAGGFTGFTVSSASGCSDAGVEQRDACSDAGVAHFQADVAPIIAGCSGEVCHLAPTYQTMVGRSSSECCTRLIVAPGDPNASYLVDKLEGRDLCSGARMPLDLAPLDAQSIATVVAWICDGAKDD